MLSREGLGVFLLARLKDDLPVLGAPSRVDARIADIEPVCRDAQLGPVPDRCPGAVFQLGESVGGDGADGMRPRAEDPNCQPGSHDRLASAVAARDAHQNRHHGIAAIEPHSPYLGCHVHQELRLVDVRAFLVL